MLLYRIAKCQYARDLSGTGARLYGGRWNSIGRPVVYMASSRALAVLEVLVHLPPALIPNDFCQATFEVPDDADEIIISSLPPNWQEYPEPSVLKTMGDAFLKANRHLLLKVPSAVVTQEYNYLLNPAHTAMQNVKLVDQVPFNFDERLIG